MVDDMIVSSDCSGGSLDRTMVLDALLQAVQFSLVLVFKMVNVLAIAAS